MAIKKIAKLVGILLVSLALVFSSCSSGEDYYEMADYQDEIPNTGSGGTEVNPPSVSNRPIVSAPDVPTDNDNDSKGETENKPDDDGGNTESETKQMPLPNFIAVENPRMPKIQLSEHKAIYQFALAEIPNLSNFKIEDYVCAALMSCGFEVSEDSNNAIIEDMASPFDDVGQDNYIIVSTDALNNFATSSVQVYITYYGDDGLKYCRISCNYDHLFIRESTLNQNAYRLHSESLGGLTYEQGEFPQDELDRLLAQLAESKRQLTTAEILEMSNSVIIGDSAILPYNTVDYLTFYNEFALSQGQIKVKGAAVALNNEDELDNLLKRHYDYIIQFNDGLNLKSQITDGKEQVNSALGRTWNAVVNIGDYNGFYNQDTCNNAGLNPFYTNLVGAATVSTGDYVPVSYIGINNNKQFTVVWYDVSSRRLYRIWGQLPDDSDVANDRDKFYNVMQNLLGGRDEYRTGGAKIIRQPN